jgi:hypothetical protein
MNDTRIIRGRKVIFERGEPPRGPVETLRYSLDVFDERENLVEVATVGAGRMGLAKKPLRTWRITLIREKGKCIGTDEAESAEVAIKVAIREIGITDPERQKRFAAQRVE